jgi:tetratricopeptide (TPR) repeat protein
MMANSFDWDDELLPETEEEVYQALLRALRRKQGFGLFFVQCSKDQGEKVVADLRQDLTQQNIQELHLQGEVVTLYDQIADLWQQKPFNVLVIEGLQASLYAYEDTKRFGGWSSNEIYNYSWKGVPKILNHLNQQREHLRNDFPSRFVFLVPPFVVDYFIQRAADFLDWRSGLFRFPRHPKEIMQDVDRFVLEGHYSKYLALAPRARIEKILQIKSLQEICPDCESKTKLLSELGLLFEAEQDYGNAIASYDKALEIKPDFHEAWNNRGRALDDLGRYEEAIANYDKALEFKPNLHEAWFFRGRALSKLGLKEEEMTSYNKILAIKPDNDEAWFFRGNALYALGNYEESLISYDKALQIQPNCASTYYNKACCYGLQKKIDLAIESLQYAITLDSECRDMAKTDSDFDGIRDDDRFQALLEE